MSWQFLCGEEDHTNDNIRVIGLGEVIELDESLNALFEIPVLMQKESVWVQNGFFINK
ncbi:MAG: hypothetical protein JEZ14_21000 [Marinilabiliaceae bacterium]|nr:hypothetical protein [Marinilabiliaceae bacterium]